MYLICIYNSDRTQMQTVRHTDLLQLRQHVRGMNPNIRALSCCIFQILALDVLI